MTVSQAGFASALLNPDMTAPPGLIAPHGRPAGKRFDVYRNTVSFSLIQAMQIGFPVIRKLVGDACFKSIAATYVITYPPKSPILMFYGTEFPRFLADLEQVQTLPCLPDIARLELLRRAVYHAADSTPVAEGQLAGIAPSDLTGLKLTLSPAVRLIASNHPIMWIWQANMGNDVGKPKTVGDYILLTRPALDVKMQNIDHATYVFMSELYINSLGQAYDKAMVICDDFDLPQAIWLLLHHKLVVEIKS